MFIAMQFESFISLHIQNKNSGEGSFLAVFLYLPKLPFEIGYCSPSLEAPESEI